MSDPVKNNIGDDSGAAQIAQTPVSPVAPKLKEQAPAQAASSKSLGESNMSVGYAEADKVAKEEGDEYWESYAREIELEKKILEMGGIEKLESGEVKIPDDLAKEMGIEPSVGIQTPMETATGFSVRGVTLDDSQLTAGLTKSTSSGLRWLVEWFILQLLKAHFHIKRIKGKVTREKAN